MLIFLTVDLPANNLYAEVMLYFTDCNLRLTMLFFII